MGLGKIEVWNSGGCAVWDAVWADRGIAPGASERTRLNFYVQTHSMLKECQQIRF